jgi:hypothetical protein
LRIFQFAPVNVLHSSNLLHIISFVNLFMNDIYH